MAKNPDYLNWTVQLAKTYEPGKIKLGNWFSVSRKMNGTRCVYLPNTGDLVSRNGKKFKGFKIIQEQLAKLIELYPNFFNVFDGELVYENHENLSDNAAFKKGNGIANASVDMSEKHKLKFVIFDTLPFNEFMNNYCTMNYVSRHFLLRQFQNTIDVMGLNKLEIVEIMYQGEDISIIDKLLDKAVMNKWEGIMLNLDKPYDFKRSANIFKYKRFDTIDLEVIDFYEMYSTITGEPKGTLGGVVCKFIGNDTFANIRVGSGFDDEMRAKIWANKGDYFGKTIECKYKDLTSNKATGLKSIQFPVFLQFREDK